MDLVIVAFAGVSLIAVLLVVALGSVVRRAPRLDYEAELAALANSPRLGAPGAADAG